MRELLTVTEYAKRAGLNKSTVSRAVTKGLIPNHAGPGAPPRIDPVEADDVRLRNIDPAKVPGLLLDGGEVKVSGAEARGPAGGPAGDGGDAAPAGAGASDDRERGDDRPTEAGRDGKGDYLKARTAREAVNAQRARVDYEERIGKLLDRGEVVDAFHEIGAIIQRVLDQRAYGMAERLMGAENVQRMTALIREEDRKLLEAMADRFAKLAGENAGTEVSHAA